MADQNKRAGTIVISETPASDTTVEPGLEQASANPSQPQPSRNQLFEQRHLEALNRTRASNRQSGHTAQKGAPRHTSRQSALLKRAFLDAISRFGNIGYAAEQVGVGRSTFYGWLEHDEEFAQGYRQAEIRATEVLEKEAWRRATEGSPYTRTSYYRGEPVGTDHKIEYSDQLLTLLLRARAPERYREKVDMTVSQVVKAIAGVDPASVL